VVPTLGSRWARRHLIPTAARAEASSGPCFPGQRGAPCQFQTAKVTSINDGDTVKVRLHGSRRVYWVRFRAVQAMELTRYSDHRSKRRGQCHAVAAANRVEDLVRASHYRVRLSSQHPSTDALPLPRPCSDPYQGALKVAAHPRRPESATIRNVSGQPVDLYGYAFTIEGTTAPFAPGTILQPGETMTFFPQGSPDQDTRDERHLGLDGYALPDAGGWVSVSAFNQVALGCDAWGSGRC
jgi:hypothetical protein